MQSNCAEAVNELQAVLTTPNVPGIKQMLVQVRPELEPESPTFRAAVLLLVGPAVGFNIDRLAVRTQAPRPLVAACTRRLFDNGVWQPDGPSYTWTTPDDEAFWKDVAVAEGRLCRRTDRLGRIEWASAGSWRKAYEFVADEDETLTIAYMSEGDLPAKVSGAPRKPSEDPVVGVVAELVQPEVVEEAEVTVVPALAGIGFDTHVWLGAPPGSTGSDTSVWLGAPSPDLFPRAQLLM